ncbi:hypothetical protein CALVIDRAFT_260159 [Calocera viscosa TUFC12733]|uniref:F-box domain-containing protein n=1 Tax=Calocera viscosa (strain TUFC12733) TaxID=1330018 RepID=A0A167J320_CALVF|nr:hypothetical protein CALVIDRAFT_260159 [Calocera viscosa TUFC12733]
MAFIFKSPALKLRHKSANHLAGRPPQRDERRYSNALTMDKLPLELCELVLQHLPAMSAWRCRLVCQSWRRYIEETLSRDWLIGSRLLMMYINHPRMLVLDTSENCDFRLTRGDLILDLVARQDDFLVFKFTPSSTRALLQLTEDDTRPIRDFWPNSLLSAGQGPSGLRSIRQLSRKELKLYIWTLSVAPPTDILSDVRLLTLRATASGLFSIRKRRQDFKLQPPDSLIVHRRVLFSKLFGEADNQNIRPVMPFLTQSL